MNANLTAKAIRRGAIVLAGAAAIVAVVRVAPMPHGVRPRVLKAMPRAVAAPRGGAGEGRADDELLAKLRARLAAGAPVSEIDGALVEFGRVDPAKAMEFAQWLARTPIERHGFVLAVADDWARRDPDAAWRWALATGTACDVPGQPPLPAEVLIHVADRDADRAVALLGSVLQREDPGASVNVAVVADCALGALLERGDSEAAWRALQSWASAPAADSLGRAAFERMATALAKESPAEAAEKLRGLPASPGRNFALTDVVADWAAREPRRALTWAQSLPAEACGDVSAAAFARWQESDPLGAAEWLVSAANIRGQDRMIAHLVSDSRVVQADLPAALSLAENVGEPRLRCQCLESVIRRWAKTDAVAASDYVTKQTTLSSEEKREILASLRASAED